MSGSLSMTLDDMVKRTKIERSGGRGRSFRGHGRSRLSGGRRGIGAVRSPLAVNVRRSSFSINKPLRRARNLPRQNLFEESLRAAGISGVEVGTRLYVSNLHQGVTNEDIRGLFSEFGEIKRYAIHFDKNGRPSGSAEVVYLRRSDAFEAVKRYNNVLLDGKHIKIEIVGDNTGTPDLARDNLTGAIGRNRTVVMTQRGGRGTGRLVRGLGQNRHGSMKSTRGGAHGVVPDGGRGGGRGGGRARGRGGGRARGRGGARIGGRSGGRGKKPVEKSAAELDMELDSYHAEAMDT